MKFSISTYDLRTFTSILWYANSKCKNNNTHHFFVGECLYHDENDNDLIDFIGFDNEFIFYHNDTEIKLVRNRIGNPSFINSRGEAGHYEELTMEILSDLSDDEKLSFMKKFILDVKEEYKNNKKIKNKNESLFLYSYSGTL